MRSIHVNMDIHSQQFFRGVPNIPNQLIGLGHDPESFYDKEMVGHICLNKYDLGVWFNRQLNLGVIKSWFEFIVYFFEDTLYMCR